jgi:hypothetical protein
MTALHYACSSGPDDTEKIKLLLDEGGANINALNKAGKSPLHLAIDWKGESSATAVYLALYGGKDLGPPRTRHTSPCSLVQWLQSDSPPIRQATSRSISPLPRSIVRDLAEAAEVGNKYEEDKKEFEKQCARYKQESWNSEPARVEHRKIDLRAYRCPVTPKSSLEWLNERKRADWM